MSLYLCGHPQIGMQKLSINFILQYMVTVSKVNDQSSLNFRFCLPLQYDWQNMWEYEQTLWRKLPRGQRSNLFHQFPAKFISCIFWCSEGPGQNKVRAIWLRQGSRLKERDFLTLESTQYFPCPPVEPWLCVWLTVPSAPIWLVVRNM